MKHIDYSAVDWSRHDAAIARDLGVTRAAVGKARLKAGAPPSKMPVRLRLNRSEWKGRAAILCEKLVEWHDMAGEDDLTPEMKAIEWIFAEARTLKETA